MILTSFKMSDNHSLVSVTLAKAAPEKVVIVKPRTNWIFTIDCSGSMWGEIDKIRTELKNKLPNLVKDGDTVTIIWFSGRGQFGTLVEGLEIKSLQGLDDLQKAIDRYLRPMGLTGFKEPLETVGKVVERVTAKEKITAHSLLFLTDGHDNCWGTQEIMKAVEPLGKSLASVTFVEYGYYCNRPLLTQMAEKCGGQLIFSEAFQDFQPTLEKYLGSEISGKPKKEINLPTPAKYDFAFSFSPEDGVVSYAVEDQKVLVDDSVNQVYYHSVAEFPEQILIPSQTDLPVVFASMLTLSQRMKPNDVYATLNYLGDVEFTDKFTNAFGKQNLYAFQNMTLEVVQGQREPYKLGKKVNYVPSPNAFCLMDMFNLLMTSDENRFISEHKAFSYNRIGAKKVMAPSKAEVEASAKLEVLTEEFAAGPTAARKAELVKEIAEVSKEVSEALVYLDFVPKPNPYGTPITDLVWNESRPNLSLRVKQYGTIDLPNNDYDLTTVESFRYRNYTIVKDGIVNVKKLPVKLSEATFLELQLKAPQLFEDEALVNPYDKDTVYVLELTKLPIINRQMVTDVSAKELFTTQFELIQAKGSQSVFNYFQKLHFPKENVESAKLYSEEAAAWLKELGITDFNGFAPKVTDEKIGESYLSTEINVKIAGISSTPSAKDVWAKYQAIAAGDAKKQLTAREEVLREGLRQYKEFTESSIYLENEKKDELLKTWLLNKQEVTVKNVRGLLNKLARIKFAVILGQVWFKEFASLDENQMTLEFNGKPYDCTVLLENKEVEI